MHDNVSAKNYLNYLLFYADDDIGSVPFKDWERTKIYCVIKSKQKATQTRHVLDCNCQVWHKRETQMVRYSSTLI